MEQRLRRNLMGREFLQGKIDTIALCVLLDIAQNIGELEGNTRFFGQFFCALIGISKDSNANQSHNRRYEVAVAIKTGPSVAAPRLAACHSSSQASSRRRRSSRDMLSSSARSSARRMNA